ncbi:phage tail protein [Pedobacter frigiditerrae]|uniref:Phage tail protein n=2 Tax=Pedobacter frigiditerrae TaxID=2530452 RepID=A0A4R0N378_9SPHI|nr:phage tail protein [Pedobacter frigiditerrae]
MMEPYIGEIRMFAGTYAPQGWLTCDGQLLSINRYSALFSLIGTSYGGDGMQNFALPNFVSRAPVHAAYSDPRGLTPYIIGQPAGQEKVTLSQGQMPAHNHLVNTVSIGGKQWSPTGGLLAGSGFVSDGTEVNSYSGNDSDGTLSPKAIAPAGGNQPVNITPPILAVTFIIALEGVWPPRP